VQKMCTRVVILDHGTVKADTTDLSQVEQLFRESTHNGI